MNVKNDLKISRRKLYKIKQKYKSKLPDFIRYDADKYLRLSRHDNWRRPRGIDNKTRLKLKGFPPIVSIGYKKPKEIRGSHPSGYKVAMVSNLTQLEQIKDKKDIYAVILSGKLGLKKRIEILAKAKEYGIKVLNAGEIS